MSASHPVRYWFYGWTIVAVGIFFQALGIGLTFGSFTFWVAPWVSEFGTLRADVLLAAMTANIVAACIAPLLGPLMDRWSIRALVSLGLLSLALGFIGLSFATALWHIIAIYGVAMAFPIVLAGPLAAQTLTAKWFRARRGLALGLIAIGPSLGTFMLAPLIGFLLTHFQWRSTFLIISALVMVAIPAVLHFVRNSPDELGIEPEPAPSTPQESERHTPYKDLRTPDILTDRNFWLFGLCFLPTMIVAAGFGNNLAPFGADLKFSVQAISFVIAATALTSICGSILFGRLADKYDLRWLVYLCVSIQSAGFLLMSGRPAYVLFFAANLLVGLGSSGFLPLQGAIIARYFGANNFGRVMGLLGVCYVMAAFGGPLAGTIRDQTGSYQLFNLGAALIMPFAALLVLLMRERRPDGATRPDHRPADHPITSARQEALGTGSEPKVLDHADAIPQVYSKDGRQSL